MARHSNWEIELFLGTRAHQCHFYKKLSFYEMGSSYFCSLMKLLGFLMCNACIS